MSEWEKNYVTCSVVDDVNLLNIHFREINHEKGTLIVDLSTNMHKTRLHWIPGFYSIHRRLGLGFGLGLGGGPVGPVKYSVTVHKTHKFSCKASKFQGSEEVS